jgi:hypothetical protein
VRVAVVLSRKAMGNPRHTGQTDRGKDFPQGPSRFKPRIRPVSPTLPAHEAGPLDERPNVENAHVGKAKIYYRARGWCQGRVRIVFVFRRLKRVRACTALPHSGHF